MKYAIIGGTGFYGMSKKTRELTLETPYGSVDVTVMKEKDKEIVFLPRHGKGHGRPPHLVNYLGNMKALKDYGVEFILATAAVGSTRSHIVPGDLVILKDFLDFTRNRPLTYYDGSEGVVHASMVEPYCSQLRTRLHDRLGEEVRDEAVYVCTEGPRFETAAEIRFYGGIGGDVVGMTNVPEVVLARELSMCYSTVGIVTNMCTGIGEFEETGEKILGIVERRKKELSRVFVDIFMEDDLNTDSCNCRSSLIRV